MSLSFGGSFSISTYKRPHEFGVEEDSITLIASLGPIVEIRIQGEKVHRLIAEVKELKRVAPIGRVIFELVALVVRKRGQKKTISIGCV